MIPVPPSRNLSVDLIKLVAAFGVILIHLGPSDAAAGTFTRLFQVFAVPFFLLISLHFFISRVTKIQPLKLGSLHWDRLLVPYAVWTVIYLAARMAKHQARGDSISFDWVAAVFYGGSSVQLYFLPLLLLFQALTLAVVLLGRSPRQRLIAAVLAMAVFGIGYVGSTRDGFGFLGFFEKSLIYTGLAFLLRWMQGRPGRSRLNFVLGIIIMVAAWTAVLTGHESILPWIIQEPLVGYGACALVLNWRFTTGSAALRSAFTCSYGIYLAHSLLAEGFEFLGSRLGHPLPPYTLVLKLAFACFIALGCLLFIRMARLHRWTAYLFLGESREPKTPSS